MVLNFFRKHHLLAAISLLALSIVLYSIGLGVGAVILLVSAGMTEVLGWYLLFTHSSAERVRHRRD